MKLRSKKTAGMISAALMLAAASAVPAHAGVSADAQVASTYLFRGLDVSDGNAQVSGTLMYSHEGTGLYGSGWASSAGNGTQEYDLAAGWAPDLGAFKLDLGAVAYVYPGTSDDSDNAGKETEAYLGLGYGWFEFYYYDNVASATGATNGYEYYSFNFTFDKVAVVLGYADPDEPKGQDWDGNYVHLDLSYAFNDNLTFTASKIVSVDDDAKDDNVAGDAAIDDDALFLVSYSLPIK
jgi:uncharacterized protein (TIGR02001 family)